MPNRCNGRMYVAVTSRDHIVHVHSDETQNVITQKLLDS